MLGDSSTVSIELREATWNGEPAVSVGFANSIMGPLGFAVLKRQSCGCPNCDGRGHYDTMRYISRGRYGDDEIHFDLENSILQILSSFVRAGGVLSTTRHHDD